MTAIPQFRVGDVSNSSLTSGPILQRLRFQAYRSPTDDISVLLWNDGLSELAQVVLTRTERFSDRHIGRAKGEEAADFCSKS